MDTPTYPFEETSLMDGPLSNDKRVSNLPAWLKTKNNDSSLKAVSSQLGSRRSVYTLILITKTFWRDILEFFAEFKRVSNLPTWLKTKNNDNHNWAEDQLGAIHKGRLLKGDLLNKVI